MQIMSLSTKPTPLSPQGYLLDIFSSKAAREGAVIRRKSRDIDRYIGRDVFVSELHRRGYRAVENAGQIIIFCNAEPVRPLI
ncbi:N-(5'-phosphoribosyl)anthranilate isomerase [Tateyamaria pelophila]|uniref:N-(5'-phosphoribosyl)anthranilate isomerase n=1 Tax=Tateyamaria pelophila TaxID=328415 RepID=UPI0029589540|nr:N-(5'-phosphoribosyl)anthranilate isomerase [Tateyamaria pelophila]